MPKTTTTTIEVKGMSMHFTDDTTRKALPCKGCKKPTTGRVGRAKPACLDCALRGILSHFRTAA